MEKQQLRKRMLQARKAEAGRGAQAAADCLRQLERVPEFLQAKTLFCYASYGTELPTGPIAAFAEQRGKRLAYPKVLDAQTMRFYRCKTLEPGYRGIPEPTGGEEALPAPGDFMLLPGLAFSKGGDRLGYGKGYYDRYLAGLAYRPICCGLGFENQLLEALPKDSFDQKLDLLVTPENIYWF